VTPQRLKLQKFLKLIYSKKNILGIYFVEYFKVKNHGGGWFGRAEAQWRPRVSKLRAKGLSDYQSTDTVVEAARLGASEQNKGLLSRHVYTKKEKWKVALSLIEKRTKGSLPDKKHLG
jgi:hypothetical protein